MPSYRRFFAVISFLLALGCTESNDETVDIRETLMSNTVVVYVVNYPLLYFAQSIGGDRVEVRFPIPPDVDPAFWSPTGDDVAGYQQADLILLNGAGYAQWISRASLPMRTLVDTTEAVSDRYLTIDNAVTHTHGPTGDHSHGTTAFTTWLDPELAIAQAASIRDALIRLRPDDTEFFEKRFLLLQSDLQSLDKQIQVVTAAITGEPLLFSHPVYQYFIPRYGLNGVELHWEPDVEPSERMWRELSESREEIPARWMIWEAKPLKSVQARLESMGVNSIVFAPGANVPENGDYLSLMATNAVALRAIERSQGD